jgi:hypothetical protein
MRALLKQAKQLLPIDIGRQIKINKHLHMKNINFFWGWNLDQRLIVIEMLSLTADVPINQFRFVSNRYLQSRCETITWKTNPA